MIFSRAYDVLVDKTEGYDTVQIYRFIVSITISCPSKVLTNTALERSLEQHAVALALVLVLYSLYISGWNKDLHDLCGVFLLLLFIFLGGGDMKPIEV